MTEKGSGKLKTAQIIIGVLLTILAILGGYTLSNLSAKDRDLTRKQDQFEIKLNQLQTFQLMTNVKLDVLLKVNGVSDEKIKDIEKAFNFKQ